MQPRGQEKRGGARKGSGPKKKTGDLTRHREAVEKALIAAETRVGAKVWDVLCQIAYGEIEEAKPRDQLKAISILREILIPAQSHQTKEVTITENKALILPELLPDPAHEAMQ